LQQSWPGAFVEGPCVTGLSDVVTSGTDRHCIERQTHIWGKYKETLEVL